MSQGAGGLGRARRSWNPFWVGAHTVPTGTDSILPGGLTSCSPHMAGFPWVTSDPAGSLRPRQPSSLTPRPLALGSVGGGQACGEGGGRDINHCDSRKGRCGHRSRPSPGVWKSSGLPVITAQPHSWVLVQPRGRGQQAGAWGQAPAVLCPIPTASWDPTGPEPTAAVPTLPCPALGSRPPLTNSHTPQDTLLTPEQMG